MSVFRTSLIILACIAVPTTAHAQLPTGATSPLTMNVSPKHPEPGETVRFEIQSAQFDIARAQVVWRVDGSVAERGVGTETFSIQAGTLGSETTVSVQARAPGGTGSARTTVRPARVTLLWKGETYVPPFYDGIPLHTAGSQVTVVAFPELVTGQGEMLNPENLIYTWYRGTDMLQDRSGRGRRSITLDNPGMLRNMPIRVTVSNLDETRIGEASSLIPVNTPKLRIYTDGPLLGTQLHRAHNETVSISEGSKELTAIPYFTSLQSRNGSPAAYTWRSQGNVLAEGGNTSSVTLQPQESEGSVPLNVSFSHADKTLQNLERELTVTFE